MRYKYFEIWELRLDWLGQRESLAICLLGRCAEACPLSLQRKLLISSLAVLLGQALVLDVQLEGGLLAEHVNPADHLAVFDDVDGGEGASRSALRSTGQLDLDDFVLLGSDRSVACVLELLDCLPGHGEGLLAILFQLGGGQDVVHVGNAFGVVKRGQTDSVQICEAHAEFGVDGFDLVADLAKRVSLD